MSNPSTFICPNCGGDVPAKALACPHCGSDEKTGWSDQTYLDGIDLPDDDFVETLKRDYGVDLNRRHWKPLVTVAASLLMIGLFILYLIRC